MFRPLQITTTVALAMIVTSVAQGQSFLERLERVIGGEQSPPVTEGREPGYLGLVADRNDQGGLVVLQVDTGGAAQRAGLRAGDRLLAINDQPLKTLDGMAALLEPVAAGETIRVQFVREGKQQTTEVTLQAPPPQTPALERLERQLDQPPPARAAPRPTTRGAFLGVQAAEINDALRDRHGLAIDRGAVIERVTAGSPADRAGLPAGAAIVAVDAQPIDSPAELAQVMATSAPGDDVEVSYYRGRQLFRTQVRLAASPAAEAPLRLGSGETPLPLEPPPPELPPGDEFLPDQRVPSGNPPAAPLFDGQRPAGRLLNRVLEGVQQTDRPPPPDDVQQLRRHVEAMEGYIERLEQRIAELEARLEAGR